MGLGDEIMVTALVKQAKRKNNFPSVIVNSKSLTRWSLAWENNPFILNTKETAGRLPNSFLKQNYNMIPSGNGGGRHYINYQLSRHHQYYIWKEWDIEPGEIYLSEKENELARSFQDHYSAYGNKPLILVEPTFKGHLQGNKDWGTLNWLRLIELFDKHMIIPVQLTHFFTNTNITLVQHKLKTMRELLAYISVADTFITTESGFHHAAAAFNIPGVVIFGGFISPRITGYKMHTNIFPENDTLNNGCGMLIPCQHCKDIMAAITPEQVCYETLKILERKYG